MSKSIFIISFYNNRSPQNLEDLIKQLLVYGQEIAVVVNIDNFNNLELERHKNLSFLKRVNEGMNIGAWDQGWRYFSDFDNYFFFQDECFLKDKDFFERYEELLSIEKNGIIGESINPKWNKSWDEMTLSPLNYQIKIDNKLINRVDFYQKKMIDWKINPGNSSKHLRALNWALTNKTLKLINGFPLGNNKEECIASEVAVSRGIESKMLEITQSDKQYFNFVGHQEWAPDGFSKL
jgi:hypothetical protein